MTFFFQTNTILIITAASKLIQWGLRSLGGPLSHGPLYIYIYAFSRFFYYIAFKLQVLHFYQLLLSLGIEPVILPLLAPCSTIWATGTQLYSSPPTFTPLAMALVRNEECAEDRAKRNTGHKLEVQNYFWYKTRGNWFSFDGKNETSIFSPELTLCLCPKSSAGTPLSCEHEYNS